MAPIPAHEVGNARLYLARGEVRARADDVATLGERFDTEPYLSGHSDVVALMVLTHQANVHNLITIAGYEARKALHDGQPVDARVKASAEPLVRAMLFLKEAPFASPIAGSSGFAKEFAALGPRDSQGRSLREFDLDRRLFKYPLSYLVYSESFNALPQGTKDYVYRRLHEILDGGDPAMTHLSASDREAIREILEQTKPDFTASKTE